MFLVGVFFLRLFFETLEHLTSRRKSVILFLAYIYVNIIVEQYSENVRVAAR